jgi:hypothetical protein
MTEEHLYELWIEVTHEYFVRIHEGLCLRGPTGVRFGSIARDFTGNFIPFSSLYSDEGVYREIKDIMNLWCPGCRWKVVKRLCKTQCL